MATSWADQTWRDYPLGYMLSTIHHPPDPQWNHGVLRLRALIIPHSPLCRGQPGQFRCTHNMQDRFRNRTPPGFGAVRNLHKDFDAVEYMKIACSLPHPFEACHDELLPPELEAAIFMICTQRENIAPWRLARLTIIEDIASSLEHINEFIRSLQPTHVRHATATANLAFVGVMAEAIGWADERFFYEFAITGHPLIGTIADVGIYPLKSDKEIAAQGPPDPGPLSEMRFSPFHVATTTRATSMLKRQFREAKAAQERGDLSQMAALKATWDKNQEEWRDSPPRCSGPWSLSEFQKHIIR